VYLKKGQFTTNDHTSAGDSACSRSSRDQRRRRQRGRRSGAVAFRSLLFVGERDLREAGGGGGDAMLGLNVGEIHHVVGHLRGNGSSLSTSCVAHTASMASVGPCSTAAPPPPPPPPPPRATPVSSAPDRQSPATMRGRHRDRLAILHVSSVSICPSMPNV
jgi:hypothetical protein